MQSEVESVIDVAAVAVADNPALAVSRPVAVLNVKAQLAVFDPVKLALAELKTIIETTEFDINTTAGDKVARDLRSKCVTLRTRTDGLYKTQNAPLLEAQRQMRAVKAEIEAGIAPHEARLDKLITDKEAAKEAERQARIAAEAARVDALRAHITEVAALPAKAALMDAAGINKLIYQLQGIDLDSFAEFKSEAESLAVQTAMQLVQMMEAAAAREQQAKDLAAREAELQEQREHDAKVAVLKQKIADIRACPLKALNMSADQIHAYLATLPYVSLGEFGEDLYPEADDARTDAVFQLKSMIVVKRQAEAEAERQAEAARTAAAERERLDAEARQRQLDAEAASARAAKQLKEQQDAFEAERQAALVQQEVERKAIADERARLLRENQELQDRRDAEQNERDRLAALAEIEAAEALKAASAPAPAPAAVSPPMTSSPERPGDLEIALMVSARYEVPPELAVSWLANFNAFETRRAIAAKLMEVVA